MFSPCDVSLRPGEGDDQQRDAQPSGGRTGGGAAARARVGLTRTRTASASRTGCRWSPAGAAGCTRTRAAGSAAVPYRNPGLANEILGPHIGLLLSLRCAGTGVICDEPGLVHDVDTRPAIDSSCSVIAGLVLRELHQVRPPQNGLRGCHNAVVDIALRRARPDLVGRFLQRRDGGTGVRDTAAGSPSVPSSTP